MIEDIARDDEEYGHGQVSAREQDANTREADGIVFAIPPESILEDEFSANARVSPDLVMEAEDEERSEASETVKIRSAV